MRDRFDQRQERKLDTKPGSHVVVGPRFGPRLGVVTWPGRRREWPAAEKARIIVESLTPGANVSEVARRNGLSPQQLFGWRREARELFAGDRDEARATPAAGTVQAPSSTTRGLATSKAPGAAPTFAAQTFVPPTFVPPTFVPVVVATDRSFVASHANEANAAKRADAGRPDANRTGAMQAGAIEIVIGACVVRVVGRVDAETLQTVIELVRRFACC
jgi:transposase